MSREDFEKAALSPEPIDPKGFNPDASLPYGLTTEHVRAAMQDFVDFLGFINGQLATKQIERLEVMLMPANFSSMVGEFMSSGIPKHCPDLVKKPIPQRASRPATGRALSR